MKQDLLPNATICLAICGMFWGRLRRVGCESRIHPRLRGRRRNVAADSVDFLNASSGLGATPHKRVPVFNRA